MFCGISLFTCSFFFIILFQGEGVAYRGRVLVELETKLGPSSKEVAEDLQSHEIIRVQVLQILNLWRSNFSFSYDFLQSVSMTANEKLPSHTSLLPIQ